MKHLRGQLTYANVVSSLCLFLLLGGGAAIAADQLAANSVGTKHLRKGAVTSAKIHGGAVGTRKLGPKSVYPGKIADGAVGAPQLRNEAVNGAKVGRVDAGRGSLREAGNQRHQPSAKNGRSPKTARFRSSRNA